MSNKENHGYVKFDYPLEVMCCVLDIKELIWPSTCCGCGACGSVLCNQCYESIVKIDVAESCLSCGAPFGSLVCTACKEELATDAMICVTTYEGVASHIVKSFKDGPEVRLASVIAHELWSAWQKACAYKLFCERLGMDLNVCHTGDACDSSWYATFVPATQESLLKRGFDHMALVGHEWERYAPGSLIDIVIRSKTQDQRFLTRQERQLNLQGACQVFDTVEGMNFLVLDDVVTTGSTISQIAQALKERGARCVVGLAFCRVW